ncbi:hypothetical protein pb186bvf_020099 [Paramecium bursaria]
MHIEQLRCDLQSIIELIILKNYWQFSQRIQINQSLATLQNRQQEQQSCNIQNIEEFLSQVQIIFMIMMRSLCNYLQVEQGDNGIKHYQMDLSNYVEKSDLLIIKRDKAYFILGETKFRNRAQYDRDKDYPLVLINLQFSNLTSDVFYMPPILFKNHYNLNFYITLQIIIFIKQNCSISKISDLKHQKQKNKQIFFDADSENYNIEYNLRQPTNWEILIIDSCPVKHFINIMLNYTIYTSSLVERQTLQIQYKIKKKYYYQIQIKVYNQSVIFPHSKYVNEIY